MSVRKVISTFTLITIFSLGVFQLKADDDIPKAAWKRPLGQPPVNPGTKKPTLDPGHIDDGFWQGAPVGGFGAGTFSRSYRGDFVRWHIKPGVHKYESVPGNQFAMYQKSEGDAEGFAQVLTNDHPRGGALRGRRHRRRRKGTARARASGCPRRDMPRRNQISLQNNPTRSASRNIDA